MKQTLARSGAAIVALALLDGAAAAKPDGSGRTPHPPGARIADLIGQIEVDNPAAQVWAADSLAKLGPEACSAVPALVRAVRKPPKRILGTGGGFSPSVAAARALWAVRPEAVMQVLQRDHRQSSLNVIAALGGTRGVRVVKALQLAMLDHCDEVRLAATRAMGHVGAVKGQVLPDAALRRLAKAAEDRDRRVRKVALDALAGLSGGRGLPPLRETVQSSSYRDARLHAIRVLARRPEACPEHLLRAAMADRDAQVAVAARALLTPGPVGGVINAETLAAAKDLRPLSVIEVRLPHRPTGRVAAARPARARRSARPGTKASTARFATLAQLMSSLAGSEPAAARSAGKPKGKNAGASAGGERRGPPRHGREPEPSAWQQLFRAALSVTAPKPCLRRARQQSAEASSMAPAATRPGPGEAARRGKPGLNVGRAREPRP